MEESAIVIKSEVEDKVTARRERAGGEDICQPDVIINGSMLAAVLNTEPIGILMRESSQGIERSLDPNLPCSMFLVLPHSILIIERAEQTLIQQDTCIGIITDTCPSWF